MAFVRFWFVVVLVLGGSACKKASRTESEPIVPSRVPDPASSEACCCRTESAGTVMFAWISEKYCSDRKGTCEADRSCADRLE